MYAPLRKSPNIQDQRPRSKQDSTFGHCQRLSRYMKWGRYVLYRDYLYEYIGLRNHNTFFTLFPFLNTKNILKYIFL